MKPYMKSWKSLICIIIPIWLGVSDPVYALNYCIILEKGHCLTLGDRGVLLLHTSNELELSTLDIRAPGDEIAADTKPIRKVKHHEIHLINDSVVYCTKFKAKYGEVLYLEPDQVDSYTVIPVESVDYILRKDGTYFVINQNKLEPINKFFYKNETTLTAAMDAGKHFTKFRHAGTATYITTLVTILGGCFTAIVISNTNPRLKNLNLPDDSLRANKEYMKAYQYKARTMKKNNAWKNFGLGILTVLPIILLVGAVR